MNRSSLKSFQPLRCIRNGFFMLFILSYLLFEEVIWKNAVGPIVRYISSYHLYRRFLEYVQYRAKRETVLILFLLPFAVGEIVGTASAFMAARLHLYSAIALYAMKVPLIVVSLGILQNGKEKLLSYGWFARAYQWTVLQIDKLHASFLYRQIQITMSRIRSRFKNRSGRLLRWVIRLYRRIRYSLNRTGF